VQREQTGFCKDAPTPATLPVRLLEPVGQLDPQSLVAHRVGMLI
jgi:hypothetical protein